MNIWTPLWRCRGQNSERLGRTEHLQQSPEARTGLPKEGKEKWDIWQRKQRSKITKVWPALHSGGHVWCSHLHSGERHWAPNVPSAATSSENIESGKVPPPRELTDQWRCQTMNSHQKTEEDGQWTNAGKLSGSDWGCVRGPSNLGGWHWAEAGLNGRQRP